MSDTETARGTDISESMSEAEERFEHWRKTLTFFLGPIAFAAILIWGIPGLSVAGNRTAAVLAWVMLWWMGEPIPMPVTALIGPALAVVLGVAPANKILAAFGDPIIFVFVGSFLLAKSMTVHSLDRRLALSMLSLPGMASGPASLLFGFGAVAMLLSLWLSNTAVTAMMLPIGLGLLRELTVNSQPGKAAPTLSCALVLMTAYAASVGGIGTPIGTPPNLITIAQIRERLKINIGFTEWMQFAVPITLAMYAVLAVLMRIMNPPERNRTSDVKSTLNVRRAELGPWTRGQVNSCVAFGLAIGLWTLPAGLALIYGGEAAVVKNYNKVMPEAIAALLAGCLLFVLPTDWKQRQFTLSWAEGASIDWGTILIFGSGIALGGLAFDTGLADALGQTLLAATGVKSPFGITLLATGLAILISELTSNTAAATMIVPVTIAVANKAGVDPLPPAIAAGIGASFGFMLPVSTAPNALAYGTGLVPITRMARTGIVFDILGWWIIAAGVHLLAPHSPR